ncbi:MAG: DEAD/DEAH box helicase family protein [Bdellovibrionales bacterium]|nr:DEAD/DEAH box helicase family protein [Bdellovibrionales bacterium]
MPKPIKKLIINSPFKKPNQHWKFDKTKKEFVLKQGRRSASYVIASSKNKSYDEYGLIKEISLVNEIRIRMAKWKADHYSGVTGVTRRLLEFWKTKSEDSGRQYDFFFCQLEAIETLIFLVEASDSFKQGLKIPKDESLNRLCCKMATGTGKTVVMAMTIAWQVLNKVIYPKDTRFSKNIFIVAPNLTVRERLKVLTLPGNNYYKEYKIIPKEWLEKFRQGFVLIKNWHQLQWETEEQIAKRKGVDKRGVKSDYAYVKEVLEGLAVSKNIVVLNDEAHHAWRYRNELKIKRTDDLTKADIEKATKWIEGLDRINRKIGINHVFDFSATPYAPTGKTADERNLFEWIVSDFGLTDAIESGLVKTPKFAVGDDASADVKNLKPKFYHIYENEEVKMDLNRTAKETESLPDIVKIAYTHLTQSWKKKYEDWKKNCKNSKEFFPPVLISVVNRKETADRVEFSFKNKDIPAPQLFFNKVSENMLKIYSGMEEDEEIRDRLSNVGKVGKSGQNIQHIISVAMLSEGWNCKTVTHIIGLRAFSSQLLCEQTIGRGLRRMSYELNEEGMFESEYVNVLGVPFAYLPQEGSDRGKKEEVPRYCIFPEKEKSEYEITWPNVERIDCQLRPKLKIDFKAMSVFTIDVASIPRMQELAPIIDGSPRYENIEVIKLQEFFEQEYRPDRLQTLILKISSQIYDKSQAEWKKGILKPYAIKMIFQLVEKFINSSKFKIKPAYEKERKDLIVMIKMNEIVNKVFSLIQKDSIKEFSVVYNEHFKFSSTGEIEEWWTKKKTALFKKTHMNQCVVDSSWEYTHARELDKNKEVLSWVKNDHLGFRIEYMNEKGKIRNYIPDFIIKLSNGNHLILEVKGIKKKRDIHKWDFMRNWCKAVSEDLQQKWHFEISQDSTGGLVHKIIENILKQQ